MWRKKELPVIDVEAIGFQEAAYYIIGSRGHRIAFPAVGVRLSFAVPWFASGSLSY
jgi:hypothetical protein